MAAFLYLSGCTSSTRREYPRFWGRLAAAPLRWQIITVVKMDASGRALRTVKKASGGKMARPAPCPASRSCSREGPMLRGSSSVAGAFLSEKAHPLYSRNSESSCSALVLGASKLCRWLQSALRRLDSFHLFCADGRKRHDIPLAGPQGCWSASAIHAARP